MGSHQEVREGGLLAIDLGLRMGLARFDVQGRVCGYHAQHFASRAALKRQVYATLAPMRPLDAIIMEGDRALAAIWRKLPERKWGIPITLIQAHTWREALLLPRQREHGGSKAKQHAQDMAAELIAWSDAPLPTSTLRHDAAEAILIGAWACAQRGWYDHHDDAPSWLTQGLKR